jgi:hypothetical protein
LKWNKNGMRFAFFLFTNIVFFKQVKIFLCINFFKYENNLLEHGKPLSHRLSRNQFKKCLKV